MRSLQQPRARSAQLISKKREPERCQKTELRGEKISEACVARRRLLTVEVFFHLTERS